MSPFSLVCCACKRTVLVQQFTTASLLFSPCNACALKSLSFPLHLKRSRSSVVPVSISAAAMEEWRAAGLTTPPSSPTGVVARSCSAEQKLKMSRCHATTLLGSNGSRSSRWEKEHLSCYGRKVFRFTRRSRQCSPSRLRQEDHTSQP